MIASYRTVAVALAVSCLVQVSTKHVAAQPPNDPNAGEERSAAVTEARERFRKAVALNAAGKVKEALVEFQAAYALSPNWKLLYNIGQCSKLIGDNIASLRAFERYLAEGKQSIPRARRSEVERQIDELKAQLGRIDVSSSTTGMQVTLDGLPQGKTPLVAPLFVNPGRHELSATKDGAPRIVREITISKGERIELALELSAPAAASEEPAPSQPTEVLTSPTQERMSDSPPDRASSDSRSLWITVGWVTTGALAVGTTITGLMALSASDDLAKKSYSGAKPPAELEAQSARVNRLAIITDVLGGAAILTAGATLFLMTRESNPVGAQMRSRTAIGLSPGGVTLQGSF